MKITRINTGIYEIQTQGRTFIIERVEDGTWQLIEEKEHNSEYWNHFRTLAGAKAAVKIELGL